MRAYKRHAAFVSLFLAAYVLLGCAFRFTRPGGEVFPVSSWTLFLRVPNRVSEYDVELLALRGETLSEPLSLHGAPVAAAGDIAAERVVQRMGRALERGDAARLAELRALFEGRWLGPESAPGRYRLVRRHYSPLERWRGGAAGPGEEIARFAFGDTR